MDKTMKFRYPLIIFLLLLVDITLVVWSCSERNPTHPNGLTVPAVNPDPIVDTSQTPPILLSTVEGNRVIAGTGSLGFYKVKANSETRQGEVFEIRKAMNLGDPHDVDVTSFLTSNPCSDCFQVTSVDYTTDEYLVIGFTIRHPFGLPLSDPPQSRERLDLHVFDLAGIIFLPDGELNESDYHNLATYISSEEQPSMLTTDNSGFWASDDYDGYTGDFDDFVDGFFPTRATLHPYKILILDPTRGNINAGNVNGFDDVRNPSGHNVFAQGKTYQSDIKFKVPTGESVEFIIALTAAYGESAKGRGNMPGKRGNPRYFLPEFNRKEAWRARLSIPHDTDLLEAEDADSSAILKIEIWDWQHNYGYPMQDIDPLTSRLDALRHSSRVASCVVDIPSVNNLDVATTPSEGDGFGDTPLVYNVEVNNDKIAGEGYYYGLVGIVDEMHGSTIANYGVKRDGVTLFDVHDFITYIPFTVNVVNREGENFGINQSQMGEGEPIDYVEIIPDASDSHNIAATYSDIYSIHSARNLFTGNGWDIYLRHSPDLGTTWSTTQRINTHILGNQKNGTIQVNRMTGDIYVAYIDESQTLPDSVGSDIVIIRSNDKGVTFSAPVIVNTIRTGNQDQVTLAIDNYGALYAAWRTIYTAGSASVIHTSYCQDKLNLVFAKETPFVQEVKTYYSNPVIGVQQYGDSTILSGIYLAYKQSSYLAPDILCSQFLSFNTGYSPGVPVSNEIYGEASEPNIIIDKEGSVYVSYIDKTRQPPALKVARSLTRGLTWLHSPPLNYSMNGTMPTHPVLAIRPSNNFIFLLWQDTVNNDKNIYAIRSTDGFTYSPPFKLNNDLSLLPQEFPSVTTNQLGNIFVSWRDKRLNSIGEIYFAKGE